MGADSLAQAGAICVPTAKADLSSTATWRLADSAWTATASAAITSRKTLAVRRVTQDNDGKKTPGIDGVAKLTPKERLEMVQTMNLSDKA